MPILTLAGSLSATWPLCQAIKQFNAFGKQHQSSSGVATVNSAELSRQRCGPLSSSQSASEVQHTRGRRLVTALRHSARVAAG